MWLPFNYMSFSNAFNMTISFSIALGFTVLTFLSVIPDSFWNMSGWVILSGIVGVLAGWVIVIGLITKEINIKKGKNVFEKK
jgi:hypothetical protein